MGKKTMNSCCRCFKARTGAYIIGLLGLAISLVDFLNNYNHQDGMKYMFYFCIAGSAFYTLVQIFLLFGLIKNQACLILLWLIVQGLFGLFFVIMFGFVSYIVAAHTCWHEERIDQNILFTFFCEEIPLKMEGWN